MEKRWYIVHIKPSKEKVVEAQLSRIGIETFYPKVRFKRGKVEKVEPLFPLYMFARFSLKNDFLNVNYARGVRRVVRFGENVPSVDGKLIERLRQVEGRTVSRERVFREGDEVIIREGPFRGFIGEVLRARSGEERVLILLKAVKMSPKAEVPVDMIEPLK